MSWIFFLFPNMLSLCWRAAPLILGLVIVAHHSEFIGVADGKTFASRLHTPEARAMVAKKVKAMTEHAYFSYDKYAFPWDELRPLSCDGVDTIGSYALTLIDSMDTLAIMGLHDEFRRKSAWIRDRIRFDVDVNVSVFETHIRIVGGLLSAHFMYEEGIVPVDPAVDDYEGHLLVLAEDVATRLLPAFDTPTRIPFGTVNLRHGVPKDEIDVTSTASGGSFLLENTVLSAVTGNPRFEVAGRMATRALFRFRSEETGLVGNHINITSGQWTLDHSGLGSGIDSFVEYLFKAFILTGDLEYTAMYDILREGGVNKFVKKGAWLLEAHIGTGQIVFPFHNSLASFYGGSLATRGFLDEAAEVVQAVHSVWRRFGGMPEGFNLQKGAPQHGQLGYPLRPELAESIYFMYMATGDPLYLAMGYDMIHVVETRCRVKCGYATLADMSDPTAALDDRMDSFLISETLKYLFLMFDDNNVINNGKWVFNTEAHPIPLRSEWNLDDSHDSNRHKMRSPATSPLKNVIMNKEQLQCKRRSAVDRVSLSELDFAAFNRREFPLDDEEERIVRERGKQRRSGADGEGQADTIPAGDTEEDTIPVEDL